MVSSANEKKVFIETSMAPIPTQHLANINETNIAQIKKKANDVAQRAPASDLSVSEFEKKNLSPKLNEIRDKFMQIKNPNNIRTFLDELDRDYNTFPDEVKYIAAQLQILRPFDGIVFRLSNLFEENKVTHSYILSFVSATVAKMEVFFPSDQWEALFKYLTIPSDKTGPVFSDIAEFQNFLMEKVNPVMDLAIVRLDTLAKSMNKGFYFDKKFLYGVADYESVLDRFRGIGPAEIYATLATLSFGIHNQLVFCAYDQLDLIKVEETIGRMHGINTILPDRLIGVSAKARFAKIRRFQNFLKLRPVARADKPDAVKKIRSMFKFVPASAASEDQGIYGKKLMALAFDRLKNAVQYTDAAWTSLQRDTDDEISMLRPIIAHARSRKDGLRLETWKGLISGRMAIQSAVVSRNTVRVDLPQFYLNPVEDLKDLFPTPNGFDRSPAYEHVTLSNGQTVVYRNYFSGRPIHWNPGIYGRFLTGPNGALSGDHIADAMRTLSQAWGGKQVAWPLKFVVE